MMHETAIQQSQSESAIGWKRLARPAGIVVAATALVALCAHISIPLGFTPVPITLQPFAVLLLGLLLAPRLSFAALTLYLAEGAAGLPVFSPHGPGGVAQLFGYTGGYLLAAPFAAATAGWLYRIGRKHAAAALAGAALGDAILLSCGALWLELVTHVGWSTLVHTSIVPFLGSDAAKVIAAAACAAIFGSFSHRAPQQ